MGAYANPQEIEGQFDFTQEQKSYQRMFDTITASAMKNSERLSELYATRAKQNEALIKDIQTKKNVNNTKIAEGTMNNPTGLNFSFLNVASDVNAKLNALGTRTEKENKILAQTAAVPNTVSNLMSTVSAIETQMTKALELEPGSVGSIDVEASDPGLIDLTINGFGKKDPKVAQLDWATINNDGEKETDFNTVVAKLRDSDKAWSLPEIEKKLLGGGDYGITYVPNPAENITKIQNQTAVKADGSGIFVMKDNEFTGKVSPSYLDYSRIETEPAGRTANGGYKRIDKAAVNKNKIGENIYEQAKIIVAGSKKKSNYLQSLYNNFMVKAIDGQAEKGYKLGERDLSKWEKFKDLGTIGDGKKAKKMAYSSDEPALSINEDDFAHNQVALTLGGIKEYQQIGTEYFIYEKAKRIEDKAEITPKGDGPIYQAFESKLKEFGMSNLKVGESTSKPVPIGIKEENGNVAYRAVLTKTKNGYKVRFVGEGIDQNNQ